MSARIRPLFVILISLLLVIGVGGAVLWQFGGAWAARLLVAQLEARLPGRLTLGAPVQWQLFPPAVQLADIGWRAPANEPGRIDIAELKVRTEWAGNGATGARPLRIVISGVRAELFQNAAAQWGLPLPGNSETRGGEALAWTLAGLTLDDSRVVLHPQAAAPVTLNIERAGISSADDADAQVNVSLQIERRNDAAQGTLAASLEVAEGVVSLAPFTLTLKGERGTLAGASAQIDGARMRVDPAGTARAEAVTARAQITLDAQPVELQADIADARLAAGELAATIARFDLTLPPPADATLSLREAVLSANADALSAAPLAGTVHWQGAEAAVDITLAAGDARYDLAEQWLDVNLRDWRAEVPDPASPEGRVTLSGTLDGRFWPGALRGAGNVQVQAESSRLTGQWQIDARQDPWGRVQGRVDTLDLDRWLPPQAKKSGQAAPLDAWRDLPLQLDLRVGALRWQGLRVRDARLQLNADGID